MIKWLFCLLYLNSGYSAKADRSRLGLKLALILKYLIFSWNVIGPWLQYGYQQTIPWPFLPIHYSFELSQNCKIFVKIVFFHMQSWKTLKTSACLFIVYTINVPLVRLNVCVYLAEKDDGWMDGSTFLYVIQKAKKKGLKNFNHTKKSTGNTLLLTLAPGAK